MDSDGRTTHPPMELNAKFRKKDGTPLSDATLYRRLGGSLIYLTMTQPDIAYAVQVVSQFVGNPHKNHFSSVHCLLRYIIGTVDRGLFYSSLSPLHLQGYSDTDWAGCLDTRCSTMGWCMVLGTFAISWKCKRQSAISKSLAEAKHLAMSSGSNEIVWLR